MTFQKEQYDTFQTGTAGLEAALRANQEKTKSIKDSVDQVDAMFTQDRDRALFESMASGKVSQKDLLEAQAMGGFSPNAKRQIEIQQGLNELETTNQAKISQIKARGTQQNSLESLRGVNQLKGINRTHETRTEENTQKAKIGAEAQTNKQEDNLYLLNEEYNRKGELEGQRGTNALEQISSEYKGKRSVERLENKGQLANTNAKGNWGVKEANAKGDWSNKTANTKGSWDTKKEQARGTAILNAENAKGGWDNTVAKTKGIADLKVSDSKGAWKNTAEQTKGTLALSKVNVSGVNQLNLAKERALSKSEPALSKLNRKKIDKHKDITSPKARNAVSKSLNANKIKARGKDGKTNTVNYSKFVNNLGERELKVLDAIRRDPKGANFIHRLGTNGKVEISQGNGVWVEFNDKNLDAIQQK